MRKRILRALIAVFLLLLALAVAAIVFPQKFLCVDSGPAQAQEVGADTSALGRKIDQQVYALYGLRPEEIKIVEETTAEH